MSESCILQVSLVGEKSDIEYMPCEISANEIAEKINAMGFVCNIIQDGKQSGYTEVSYSKRDGYFTLIILPWLFDIGYLTLVNQHQYSMSYDYNATGRWQELYDLNFSKAI